MIYLYFSLRGVKIYLPIAIYSYTTITEIYKIKCFKKNYMKTYENRGCRNISPNLKKKGKGKEKEKDRKGKGKGKEKEKERKRKGKGKEKERKKKGKGKEKERKMK